MAATWTLSDIQSAIRQVTGRFSSAEISNSELKKRINQYYTLIFPAEVKLEKKLSYYEFITVPNQGTYDVPQTTYTNYEPPVTCNNLSMLWYQDPAYFDQNNYKQYTFLTPWTGDGTTVTFTKTVMGFPILPGTLTISDTVELFDDTNTEWTTSDVVITGSLGGTATINYSTGSIVVTFNTPPVNGQKINLNYVLFAAKRPQAMLMYNNQFSLWPIPDQAYIIRMQAYSVVDPLEVSTDTPGLNEWGRCIVYGTARELMADYGELDGYAEITALYKEQLAYVLKRTNQSLLNVRATPTF